MSRAVALLCVLALAAGCRRGRTEVHRGPPPFAPTAEPDPTTPQARAKRVVEHLRDRKFAAVRATFDPALATALSEVELATTWDKTVLRAGRIDRIDAIAVDPEKDGHTVVHVRTEHGLHGMEIRVVLDKAGRTSGLWLEPRPGPWTPPAYVAKGSFTERAVDVAGLPGTLLLPKRPGKSRAVVLVHGSGPLDRDGTLGGRKPLRDLAEGLASKGLVVLRWDKRTKAAPGTLAAPFDLDAEVTADARAAVDLVAKQPEVDAERVYLVGHGQGASLAPRIAKKEPRVAGLVLLAGETRPFETLLVERQRHLLGLAGLDAASVEARLAAIRAECDAARDPKGAPADVLSIAGSKAPRQYWQDLLAFDPTAPARALALPMLIVQGGRDHEVTAPDYEGWKKALTRPGVLFRFHPPLDHHLVIGDAPSTPDDYRWPGHVAGEVVADVAAFVLGTLAP